MSQKNSSVQKAAADLGMATFVLSSVATMSATVFSNPMEVVKVCWMFTLVSSHAS